MKVGADAILFDSLAEFTALIQDLKLESALELTEPVLDNSGNVLLREGIVVKPAALARLEAMPGQYRSEFRVRITPPLLTGVRQALVQATLQALKGERSAFVRALFDATGHNYRKYIATAFREQKLSLAFFRLSRENPEYFRHSARLALLTLGTLMHTNARRRMIHINAFQAGLCADLALVDGNHWRNPPEDYAERRKAARQSASLAAAFGVSADAEAAIAEYPVNMNQPVAATESVVELPENPENEIDTRFFDDLNTPQEETAPARTAGAGVDDESALILTEVLRIAHYVSDIAGRIAEGATFAEELVYMTTYNASRGYFHRDFIKPILKVFTDFELGARKLMKVAELERRCTYPPSAWAYPKPLSGQILCRNHEYDCPLLIQGWDIHVIAPAEAYGWIGVDLPAGNYHKCQLGKELENK